MSDLLLALSGMQEGIQKLQFRNVESNEMKEWKVKHLMNTAQMNAFRHSSTVSRSALKINEAALAR